MSRRNVACHVLLLALGPAMPAEGADRLTIRVVSPRAGLLFTDAEPVDVRVRVSGGKHVFHLRLTGRRKQFDSNYALWFDAIALRRK